MLSGLYKTSEGVGIVSYTATIKVKETEKSYIFELVNFQGHETLSGVNGLFTKSNRIVFGKNDGIHGLEECGENSFFLYLFRNGKCLLFEKIRK